MDTEYEVQQLPLVKEGERIIRHPNGNPYLVRSYDSNGRPTGRFTEWYEDGTKCEEGEYLDSQKTGLWTEWYKNGNKSSEGKYIEWYENGDKKSGEDYLNGRKIGTLME